MAVRQLPLLFVGMTLMYAPIDKDQFSFSLGNLTYIGPAWDGGTPAPIGGARKDGIGGWLGRLLAKALEWQRQRAVMQEMAMMSDHELSDIGLSRADLTRVFDPTFAADHARGLYYPGL